MADGGSRAIAARTYGFPPGWLLGGHSLAELYAVAQGVDPRLILQIRPAPRPRPPTPAEMSLPELAARLADLADQAAAVTAELDRRAELIRGVRK